VPTNIDQDLCELDAVSAIRHIAERRLGVVEYADALLARIEAQQGLNACIHVDAERLRSAARAADSTPPSQRGALHGLPLMVKDNIDVQGMPCTAGSPALAEHRPARDAACVKPLLQAGALVLGKANLHEFALGVTSANAAYGAVRNPHAPNRTAGGSSGGTAAALAARMAPAGLGTDTGGSIRIPAAHCGVVGFRPSTGRWPGRGVVPISMPTRDTAAPMARTVEDCALLDGVVCGDASPLPKLSLRGLRLGVAQAFWQDLDASLAAQAEAARALLAAAGVEFIDCALDVNLDEVGALGLTIATAENLPALRAYFEDHGLPFDARRVAQQVASPDVRGIFEHLLGPHAATPSDGAKALATVRQHLQPAYARCLSNHALDALVLPTTPLPAGRVGEDDVVTLGGRDWPTFASYVRHAGPATLLGLPSISLPMGMAAAGLPVGLQLDALRGSDRRLLAIAAALAQVLPTIPAPR
jgi:indoleacetamide hydrolase